MINSRVRKAQAAVLKWFLRQDEQRSNVAVRLKLLAWIGCIGMPMYYLIWTIWFPQEFESLRLRAIGFALCVLALRAPDILEGASLRAYEFLTVTYVLPFFFTFMFLMNHASPVWSQSLLVALIVLFHFDGLWALASFVSGWFIAATAFAFVGDAAFLLSPDVLAQLPIYGFTMVVVSIAKVGRRVLAREKLAGMAQALATVSHELRTPLISVSANLRGLERCLASAKPDREYAGSGIEAALERIRFEVRHMNHMIDLFLQSASAMNQQLEATEHVSMANVVATVIERYPFTGQEQRALVTVDIRGDFAFRGKYELSIVLVLNLLRNALKALQRAGKGRIRIVVDGARTMPRLLIIDTGCGIPAQQLPFIFERFYSYPPSSSSGIGLALCKSIIEAWHARIRCRSRDRTYTVFALEFPGAAGVTAGLP
jgi:two-component system CAI-1 autoinducer sensor kinase/phosphatase CqsS